jgi:hypothetical protein
VGWLARSSLINPSSVLSNPLLPTGLQLGSGVALGAGEGVQVDVGGGPLVAVGGGKVGVREAVAVGTSVGVLEGV